MAAQMEVSPYEERSHALATTLLNNQPTGLSVSTLVDSFLVLYDECTNTELRRDKVIAEFVKECAHLPLFSPFRCALNGALNGVLVFSRPACQGSQVAAA